MIERGHFLPGGSLLTIEKGVNETYRGIIEVGANRIDAYVKFLTTRQLVNELAASVLGRMAGLRVPRAFLVQVRQLEYADSPFIRDVGRDIVAFATEAVGNGAACRRVPLTTATAFASFLRTWKEWPEAAAFDEWIANGDRHPGNYLVGVPGEVWLIDHSHAFTGHEWTTPKLDPLVRVKNRICDKACTCITIQEKYDAHSASIAASVRFAGVPVPYALQLALIALYLDPTELAALTTFTARRALDVHDSIGARLGVLTLRLGAPT